MSKPLDMPDGPGWFAYKGTREGVVRFDDFRVDGEKVSIVWHEDIFPIEYTIGHFKQFMGNPQFYRLTMPWDTQPATVPGAMPVPDEIAETLKLVLDFAYRDASAITNGTEAYINRRIDDVRAWLAQQPRA